MKEKMIKKTLLVVSLSVVLCFLSFYFLGCSEEKPIKVGILHSLSGTMAASGQSVCDATLMAIEEVNEKGGLLGRKIKPVIVDGKSDWQVYKDKAKWLITEEKVSVVFGSWTSASRKTIKPVFEKYDHLLFYPVQYEGMESSPNIIYTGATPNQQIIPAVKWAFDNLGKTFFLIGSDYVFPRIANIIIKDQVSALGGKIVGEAYAPLGSTEFDDKIKKIIKAKPDVIINTINGSSNLSFFPHMAYYKFSRKNNSEYKSTPILSFSTSENEMKILQSKEFHGTIIEYLKENHELQDSEIAESLIKGDITFIKEFMVGNYASWNYFESIDSSLNKKFVKAFKNKYGQDKIVDDPMESAYFGVKLWAKTVKDIKSADVENVRKALPGQRLHAPEGMVYIDRKNNHTWKISRIGKINKQGKFDIIWSSKKPVYPVPYPRYRSKTDWDKMVLGLYEMWGNKWSNQGESEGLIYKRIVEITPELRELCANPVLVSEIIKADKTTGSLNQYEVEGIDEAWKNYSKDGFFINKYLNNKAANILKNFKNENTHFKELFITDRTGLNVAITNSTSDAYQADELWWQTAFAAKKGEVFTSKVEYDESAHAWGVSVYLPVYGNNEKAVGVLKGFVDLKK